MSQPNEAATPRPPALDVQAQLAAQQDQLDDLYAIVKAQQDTIDQLVRERAGQRSAPSAPASSGASGPVTTPRFGPSAPRRS